MATMVNHEALSPQQPTNDMAAPDKVIKQESPAQMHGREIKAKLEAEVTAILEKMPDIEIEIGYVTAEMAAWTQDLMQVSLDIDIQAVEQESPASDIEADGHEDLLPSIKAAIAAIRTSVTKTLAGYKLQSGEITTMKMSKKHVSLDCFFKVPAQPKR